MERRCKATRTITAPIANGLPSLSKANEERRLVFTVRTRVFGEVVCGSDGNDAGDVGNDDGGSRPWRAASASRESQAEMFAA